ncbi:MAG: T9SS type A sorting domain-containing protein [Bacteroidales bacterium]|jgi:hypothetical protein|nr:T9SS type A sorting domain-containing protein [Bacteroidales bacterium]
MKKTFFILVITLAFNTVNSQTQPVFPDGGLEVKWVSVPSFRGPYNDYSIGSGELMHTLNSLYGFEGQEFQTELTAFKETNAHGGQYAMRLTTCNFANMLLVPGAFATLSPNFIAQFIENSGNISVVHGFEGKPTHLQGYYKFTPVGGDSAAIEIELYDFDVTIASEKLVIKQAVSEWTYFDIPIHYSIGTTSDIKIIFASSAAYDFGNLFNCQGQVGSSLFIDDIAFSYIPLGITQPLLEQFISKAYPIPASDRVIIELDKEFSGNLLIYNMLGSEVFQTTFSGSKIECNTSNLQSGNYFYRIMKENKIYSTGRIVVE